MGGIRRFGGRLRWWESYEGGTRAKGGYQAGTSKAMGRRDAMCHGRDEMRVGGEF